MCPEIGATNYTPSLITTIYIYILLSYVYHFETPGVELSTMNFNSEFVEMNLATFHPSQKKRQGHGHVGSLGLVYLPTCTIP